MTILFAILVALFFSGAFSYILYLGLAFAIQKTLYPDCRIEFFPRSKKLLKKIKNFR